MRRISDDLVPPMSFLCVHSTSKLGVLRLWQVWEAFGRILIIVLLTTWQSMLLLSGQDVLLEAPCVMRATESVFLSHLLLSSYVSLKKFILTLFIGEVGWRSCNGCLICNIPVEPFKCQSVLEGSEADLWLVPLSISNHLVGSLLDSRHLPGTSSHRLGIYCRGAGL